MVADVRKVIKYAPDAQFVADQVQNIVRLGADAETAQDAADLALTGWLYRDSRASQVFGADVWVVDGVRCSIRGRWCEACGDDESNPHGPLCKHRLAAMIVAKWHMQAGKAKDAHLLSEGAARIVRALEDADGAGVDEVRLRVWLDYAPSGGSEEFHLCGVRLDGGAWQDADRLPVESYEYLRVLARMGWRQDVKTLPYKTATALGRGVIYVLRRDAESAPQMYRGDEAWA